MIYHSFLEIPQHNRNSDEARTKTFDWILKVIAAIRRLIFYIWKIVNNIIPNSRLAPKTQIIF